MLAFLQGFLCGPISLSRSASLRLSHLPTAALLPPDVPERLDPLKQMSGPSWERMAATIGVNARQVHLWRRGTYPSGEAMRSLVRLATRVPGGLAESLGEDVLVMRGGKELSEELALTVRGPVEKAERQRSLRAAR